MKTSLLTRPVKQALAIGLGVFAVALVFGLLIYGGGGNPASAGNSPPPDASPPSFAPLTNNSTATPVPNTPTPVPATATPTPTPTPELHATPEACPDTADNTLETAEVVSEGRHAIFEVYWSSAKVELTANPCPPSVVHHVTEETDDITGETTRHEHTDRAASNINLDTTVLHVPETTKQTRPADESADSSYRDKYPFLYEDADNDPNTPKTAIPGTDEFWALPYCDPDYNDFEWATGDMCMGFSAALLHAHHFLNQAGGKPPGKITWEFESEREPGIDYNDKGRAFAFLPHDLPEVTRTNDPVGQVTWDTLDIDHNSLEMDPGTYEHRQWGFTKPGTYVFSVHAKGHPASALGAVAAQTVSSVPRLYTFHVGLLADLSVTATANDSAPDPGDEVTLTITASSKGPDAADNTQVTVELPDGLTYASDLTDDGSYDSDTGVWTIGTLAAPGEGETATTATLALSVTVDSDAALGAALDTTLEIHAIEHIGATSQVRELDPHTDDNAAAVSVTPPADDNAAPLFYVSRSIAENSAAGTNVGAPVTAKDPDGDTLTYTLTGTGADQFTVAAVATGAQVTVAADAYINYEDTTSYDLVLNVSDLKDADGNTVTDQTQDVDHYIGLTINVTDETSETLAITLTADPTTQTVGGNVKLTTTVTGATVTKDKLRFRYTDINKTAPLDSLSGVSHFQFRDRTVTYGSPVQRTYQVDVWQLDANDSIIGAEVSSNTVTVTWTSGGG